MMDRYRAGPAEDELRELAASVEEAYLAFQTKLYKQIHKAALERRKRMRKDEDARLET